MESATAFSLTCAGEPDSGIAIALPLRITQASATAAAEIRQAQNDLDEVLDVRQQARFRVFEEEIERRKVELVVRARQARRQGNEP